MIDRAALAKDLRARYAHRHEGFGFRLHYNDVRYPALLVATAREAWTRTASFFEGVAPPPDAPVEVFARSRRGRASDPRALYVGPRTAGRPAIWLNLANRDRLPLDSYFYWEVIRSILVHEFAHAFLDRAVEGRPLPAWMEEGTARYVERTAVSRSRLGREISSAPGLDLSGGDDARYRAGHAAVEYLVGRFGLAAWLDALAEAARYLEGKRGRARRAVAAAGADGDRLHANHGRDVNRRLDRLLRERFGLDRAAISERVTGQVPRERPAEETADPFDRVVLGRLDAPGLASTSVAVALAFRPAHHEAPVPTAVARSGPAIRRLLARARRERRPVHPDALLAFRLATGAVLQRPIASATRRAALDLDGRPGDPLRERLEADGVVLVRGESGRTAAVALARGLAIHLGRTGPKQSKGVRVHDDASLERRLSERLAPGECLPTSLARTLAGPGREGP